MAGEYIEFHNNAQPALNETNVNRMQQLIKQDINGAVSGDTLPVGAILPFGSDTIPINWLLCDGQAVSRTEYQELFNTIGTTFGQGDGFTTFNLPDLRDRVPIGKDSNDSDFDALGKTGEGTAKDNIKIVSNSTTFVGEGDIYRGQALVSITKNQTSSAQSLAENGIDFTPPYIVTNYIIKATQSAGVVATVVDSLNSTSTTDALSANQGRILAQKGEWVELAISSSTSEVTKTVSDLTQFSKIALICKGAGDGQILATLIAPSNNFSGSNDWSCAYAGEPNNYLVRARRLSDTSVRMKTTSQYDTAILYGII